MKTLNLIRKHNTEALCQRVFTKQNTRTIMNSESSSYRIY